MAKVMFGISNLHVGTYEDNNGTVTLGTPYHQKGAVSFSPSEDSDSNDFYADNILYWSGDSNHRIEGDLEVAMFDDAFKTQFLGYVTLTNGGLASVKNPTKPNVYVAFEVETDDGDPLRVIYYNCTLGAISRGYETITESKEPQTASITVTCIGDNNSGAMRAVLKKGDTGYSDLFTAPTAPAIAV